MLKDKTAIITGTNRGIGLATVEVFAKMGAEIWACARTKSDEHERIIGKIAAENQVTINTIYFDITDDSAVKRSMKEIGKISGKIDILVNNAGISVENLFSMTSMKTMCKAMETNFFSQVQISQIVSRYMIKQRSGSIVNVGSVAGIEREQGGLAYGSSKAAVIFSTRAMALELGQYGVRVNSVSPGFIATDIWARRDDGIREAIMRETPLGRQGDPREVANAILFLASDLSSYVTGQNIIVDGGRWGG